MTEPRLRAIVTTLVGAIAALAFLVSFRAISQFAVTTGAFPRSLGWAAPLLVDSFTLAASIEVLRSALAGQRAVYPWCLVAGATLASAALNIAHAPDHPAAEGSAIVEEEPDGSLVVRVAVTADAAPDTFREVWLITADASALVSLGVLEGSEQTFPIPSDVDLKDYVLVDVSQEPEDGDANHSGDSIVRGELTFL